MHSDDNLIRLEKPINEKTTAVLSVTFKNENGVDVNPDTATYTLYDRSTRQIINGRNGTTIAGSGATRTIELVPADNAIINPVRQTEEHRLLIEYTFGGSGKAGSSEVQLVIVNLLMKS